MTSDKIAGWARFFVPIIFFKGFHEVEFIYQLGTKAIVTVSLFLFMLNNILQIVGYNRPVEGFIIPYERVLWKIIIKDAIDALFDLSPAEKLQLGKIYWLTWLQLQKISPSMNGKKKNYPGGRRIL